MVSWDSSFTIFFLLFKPITGNLTPNNTLLSLPLISARLALNQIVVSG